MQACQLIATVQAIANAFLGLPPAVFAASSGHLLLKTTGQVWAGSRAMSDTRRDAHQLLIQAEDRLRCYAISCLPATGTIKVSILPDRAKDGCFEGTEVQAHMTASSAQCCHSGTLALPLHQQMLRLHTDLTLCSIA